MVDVDRRPPLPHGLPRPPSHAAGLRRLSTRASAPSTPRTAAAPPSSSAAAGPAPSPSAVLAHLSAAGVSILSGLSESELAVAEVALGGLQLPPELRELLALGVPSGDGFPDYRSPAGLRLLRFAAQEIPAAVAATLPLLPGRRGGRAPPPPPLVPVHGRHYVPATPCLAGNPVFHVSDSGVAFAGANVADFLLRAFTAEPPPGAPLRRQLSAPVPPPAPSPAPPSTARRSLDSVTGRAPRWIEFWTDAAAAGDRFLEVRTDSPEATTTASHAPSWLRSYLEWAGSLLRRGGWGDDEVEEITGVSPSGGEATASALKVDWCCGELRRGGWGTEEVVEVLGALLGPRRVRRASVALSPDVAARVGRLAEAVSLAVGSGGGGGQKKPVIRRF
ncbi:protein transport protein SEC31-like [Lolium rigidum]|uniref:protein transport protein SEC31-like n=1 Tax=Lolium rigidum TaxID=89674 RepID=UPI001F5CC4FD|nr:protein transport protein SEC31-like [Lolium rigidum]